MVGKKSLGMGARHQDSSFCSSNYLCDHEQVPCNSGLPFSNWIGPHVPSDPSRSLIREQYFSAVVSLNTLNHKPWVEDTAWSESSSYLLLASVFSSVEWTYRSIRQAWGRIQWDAACYRAEKSVMGDTICVVITFSTESFRPFWPLKLEEE